MKIEFDPAKDVVNQAKHGVSLVVAERFDWSLAMPERISGATTGPTELI